MREDRVEDSGYRMEWIESMREFRGRNEVEGENRSEEEIKNGSKGKVKMRYGKYKARTMRRSTNTVQYSILNMHCKYCCTKV